MQNKRSTMQKLGLVALVMIVSLLQGCGHTMPPKVIPKYSRAYLYQVIVDEKTCGPAAKQALYDWLILIGG